MGGDGSDGGGGGWVVAVAVAACHQGGKRRTEPRQLYGDQKPGAARIERLRKLVLEAVNSLAAVPRGL